MSESSKALRNFYWTVQPLLALIGILLCVSFFVDDMDGITVPLVSMAIGMAVVSVMGCNVIVAFQKENAALKAKLGDSPDEPADE